MEGFLHTKSIPFEKSDFGRTYLICDPDSITSSLSFRILAYFTITQKVFYLSDELSTSRRKKLSGLFYNEAETVGYLIGQLGKNHSLPASENPVHLADILSVAAEKIYTVYEQIGGRFMFLDCKKTNTKVCAMYKANGFVPFQDIILDEKVEYHQMIRMLHA